MWTKFLMMLSALRGVLQPLMPWFQTEAAKFVAEMLPTAMLIVEGVSKQADLSNAEKAELAAKRIAEAAKEQGKKYKESYLNQAREVAWGMVKDLLEKHK
jgi:hypothetical protein